MTAYDFVPATLESLDELQAEILVLPYFSDERPLRGAAGFVDWRSCGALSRKLMAGYLEGRFGDKALIAAPAKLRVEALLLIGLGNSNDFNPKRAAEACGLIAEALNHGDLSTAALALPGRSLNLIGALEVMQIWLAANPPDTGIEEITVIERSEEHRALESVFDGLRRQAESPLG
ncbi:MAG TPA: M17 family peptidase N-terminal domain-containing protein [Polyangiales bacterium]|nr:M17 family peptidase N-terminal domain-containing protein [Polyangiales bacterium]